MYSRDLMRISSSRLTCMDALWGTAAHGGLRSFKTVETGPAGLAGSIPVRLRSRWWLTSHARLSVCGLVSVMMALRLTVGGKGYAAKRRQSWTPRKLRPHGRGVWVRDLLQAVPNRTMLLVGDVRESCRQTGIPSPRRRGARALGGSALWTFPRALETANRGPVPLERFQTRVN